jgi:putative protein-disulfide isomerase
MQHCALHYFYDPMCGWCYGILPHVDCWVSRTGHAPLLHGRGTTMATAPGVRPANLRRLIEDQDERVAKATGQRFNQTLRTSLFAGHPKREVFDAGITLAAVQAAAEFNLQYPFLKSCFAAFCRDGQNVCDRSILAKLAENIGIPSGRMSALIDEKLLEEVPRHIELTQRLMSEMSAPGVPILALSIDSKWIELPFAPFLDNPSAWVDFALGELKSASSAT